MTPPTAEMRRAMAQAEVGDDVYGEDPTVRRLEEEAAERLGQQAGLFVPSGTMGNQIAIHILTRPGTDVVLEARSHVYVHELGAMAAWSGVLPRVVRGERGFLDPRELDRALKPFAYWKHGVLASTLGPGRVRFVTHLDVDDAALERAITAIRRAARG